MVRSILNKTPYELLRESAINRIHDEDSNEEPLKTKPDEENQEKEQHIQGSTAEAS